MRSYPRTMSPFEEPRDSTSDAASMSSVSFIQPPRSAKRQWRDSRTSSMASMSASLKSTSSSIRRRMSGIFSNTNSRGQKRVCMTCIMCYSAGIQTEHCKKPQWQAIY
ncbi:hypothetical protein C1H76_3273 [Elsinoe australis]|uniref:Uncharacterized protein n=1 Tax=Elsinoe australis TaxID=40998 RepID=A0A4U7B906_9PEZI|nr:hypothetical protein C1H76_3273 [Elsinoe australis]